MQSNLPINRLVNVSVNLSPQAAQAQSLSDLLVLGSSDVIDVVERLRTYSQLPEVATDFGTAAAEYQAAVLWFEQTPQPTQIKIGRWAATDSDARLVGATLSAAQQALSLWTAITTPSFRVTLDGVQEDVAVGSFAAVTNLNGVAALIQTALTSIIAGSTCVWDANYQRFVITSGSSGAAATISFASAAATGTNISAMLGMTSASSGAYIADGIDAETAVEAVIIFDTNFGQSWYGLTICGSDNDDHLTVGAFVEGLTNKHVYGVTTQEAGTLVSSSTTDIAYLLEQLGYDRTVVQYSSSNAYAVVSLLARILTTNYNANNTVITLMYKQEPGIVAETLNTTQVTALQAKNCNVFLEYNNDTAIIEKGVSASGNFLDIITGTDWFAVTIQNEVYNLLYTSTTKIPQTDAGNSMIANAIEKVGTIGVSNGLLAPGTWNAGGFGSLKMGDFLSKGFYVYQPPVSDQLQADREARKSVTFQVAAKLAGAVHTVDVLVNVNR